MGEKKEQYNQRWKTTFEKPGKYLAITGIFVDFKKKLLCQIIIAVERGGNYFKNEQNVKKKNPFFIIKNIDT